jgi:hypothetical protein
VKAPSSMGSASPWLQLGGLGRGGQVIKVNHNSVHSLEKKGYVKRIYAFPTAKFIITEKGKLVWGLKNGL